MCVFFPTFSSLSSPPAHTQGLCQSVCVSVCLSVLLATHSLLAELVLGAPASIFLFLNLIFRQQTGTMGDRPRFVNSFWVSDVSLTKPFDFQTTSPSPSLSRPLSTSRSLSLSTSLSQPLPPSLSRHLSTSLGLTPSLPLSTSLALSLFPCEWWFFLPLLLLCC